MLERERVIEIVISVVAVLLMIGIMLVIGSEYSTPESTLSPEGGELLVVAIVGFIALLTIIGVVLAFVLNEAPSTTDADVDANADADANGSSDANG